VLAGDYPHRYSVGEVAAMTATLARTITDSTFVPFSLRLKLGTDILGEVPLIHVGFLYTQTSTFQMKCELCISIEKYF